MGSMNGYSISYMIQKLYYDDKIGKGMGCAMEIGIITLVGSDNCGSLLQTFALQTYLEKNYDCHVSIVNYKDVVSGQTYGIFSPAIIMRPLQLFRTLQHYKRLKKQKDDYEQFRKKRLHLTNKQYHSLEELKKENWNFDIIISGSDQIWNWPEAYVDETYFLSWVDKNIRKISYAPSTGGSIDPSASLPAWPNENYGDLAKIHDCLMRYQMISVREESGQNYLERILGYNIPVVADPTLMLDREIWEHEAPDRKVSEKYIFYYSYGYKNHKLNEIVKQEAIKLGLPVYVINASLWNHISPSYFHFRLHTEGGPDTYLSLMKYAEYVFVESFHGCIFAFIYQKNFWFLNNYCDGRIEARIKSLLQYLELENRIIHEHNFNQVDLTLGIDYTVTFPKLEKLKEHSRSFLDRALLSDYEDHFTKDSKEYHIALNTNWITMNDKEIKEKFYHLKKYIYMNEVSLNENLFEQYFHIPQSDFANINAEEFLVALKKSKWYKENMEHRNLCIHFGYIGHLWYRVKTVYKNEGITAIWKKVKEKYKWWFRIGY